MPELAGQTVFLRLDLNVPLADGQISEDYKIKAGLPSIKQLLERGAKVIVASHLGEPMVNGELVPDAIKLFSLQPIAQRLSELLGEPVKFIAGQDLAVIKQQIAKASERVVILDNLRFWPGELSDDLLVDALAGMVAARRRRN